MTIEEGRPPRGEGRQEARRDATRERLLDAALDVFSRKGYHAAGVEDIVAASGSSKGGFYFHFPSKQEIFQALADQLALRLLGSVDAAARAAPDAAAAIDAALDDLLDTLTRHRRLARILLTEVGQLGPGLDPLLFAVHERFAQAIRGYLDRAVAEEAIPPQDTEMAAWVWLGALNEVLTRWVRSGDPDDGAELAQRVRAVLRRSVGLPESAPHKEKP
ncbi:MAG: TetR/AcrR family transcriptional regulator [Chloroflexi bacterium]|nr:TetR/AcrR family transcriptional regulator [Chloroflexota bacterium]